MRETLFVMFSFIVLNLFAQSESNIYGVGQWQMHTSYTSGNELAIAPDKIYCNATSGLFYLDKIDNSINKLSKLDGLSDSEIGAIAYSTPLNALIIGYTNGNIDVLMNSTVYNITGIRESININGSKRINQITTHNEYAFLSCEFGIVKLDLRRMEIKESYLNIGPNGISPSIYQIEIIKNTDSIFVASSEGVLGSSMSSEYNLGDFNNWIRYDQANGIDTANIKFVSSLRDTAYAYSTIDGLLYKNGQSWIKIIPTISDKSKATNLDNSGNSLFLSFSDALGSYQITNSQKNHLFSTSPGNPNHFQYDVGGLWAADEKLGLVKMSRSNNSLFAIVPNGPAYTDVFRMYSSRGQVFGLSGGYFASYLGARGYRKGIYKNEDFSWTNYPLSNYSDLIDMDFNVHNGYYYIASYGNGVIKWDGNNVVDVYNQYSYTIENGDTLWCPLVPYNGGSSIRTTDATVDNQGNVWICNFLTKSDSPKPIHRLSPAGKWTSYSFSNSNVTAPIKLVIDDLGTKWITLKGNEGRAGGFVFNEEFGYDKYLSESTVGLPNTNITVMKVDKSNDVWIGTAKGIAVAKEVGDVFVDNYKVEIPIYGERPLLEDEFINDIAIDGGNRIWVGTANGVYLLSPGGEEVLLNFTEKNSSLVSNNVSSISINEKTGEVFFGTEKGIISYWGNATEGEETHSSVEIFPNPVRPEFDGVVSVRGLANNAIVKFTDISGNLVYEIDAEGGMATWNMKDINGEEVSSGVYLIFSSTIDGEETFVGKVAVIR